MARSFTRRTLPLAATSANAVGSGSTLTLAETPDRVAALEAATGGRIGVAALNTGTAVTVNHRADERFHFAAHSSC